MTRSIYAFLLLSLAVSLGVLAASSLAAAQTESILYSFTGTDVDEDYPASGLILDDQGNLYGTTGRAYYGPGNGTVFMLTATGQEKVLYYFLGQDDGGLPSTGSLIRDAQGNLYGTTTSGGNRGWGVVFKLDPEGNETVLHSFTGGTDGGLPEGTMLRDSQGNFYGTTARGGATGYGNIFKLSPAGVLTTLYSFAGGKDGNFPWAGLTRDASGNFYGTTVFGGGGTEACSLGCGVVYELTSAGEEKVLYRFTGGADGLNPLAALTLDSQGNLYGTTTVYGGNGKCNATCGTIFKITEAGEKKTLYSFPEDESHGMAPNSQLLLDPSGNLYGVATKGGIELGGPGTVFELTAKGVEKTLYSFVPTPPDGAVPNGPLMRDTQGNFYGTTQQGGAYGYGAIFKLTP